MLDCPQHQLDIEDIGIGIIHGLWGFIFRKVTSLVGNLVLGMTPGNQYRVSLLFSCGLGQAFAEVLINNQMKDGDGSTIIANPSAKQENGLQMILSTGDQVRIAMPDPNSYIRPESV